MKRFNSRLSLNLSQGCKMGQPRKTRIIRNSCLINNFQHYSQLICILIEMRTRSKNQTCNTILHQILLLGETKAKRHMIECLLKHLASLSSASLDGKKAVK